MKSATDIGWSLTWSGILLGCAAFMVLTGAAAPHLSHAGELLPAGMASYPAGKITSVYETTLQINGRTYGLTSEVVLVDQRGHPLEKVAIRVDLEVKYHLQKGTTEQIDWLLLVLPR